MTDINRWATSALSRSRKNEADNEELLIHLKTGELLIKTPNGNVISYDKMSRFNSHTNVMELLITNLELEGNLSSLDLTTIEFPEVIADNINILDSAVNRNSRVFNFLISIDLDCIETLGLTTKITSNEPSISIDFEYTKMGGIVTPFNVTYPVSKLNKTLIIVPEEDNISAKINSIIIIPNPANADKTIKNILHSILILIKEE